MGTSSDQLRSEIAAKREDIGRDIETIEDRVSPGRIIHRRQNAMRERVQGVREKVMGARDAADDALHGASDSVSGTVRSTGSGARSAAQGNPLAAGMVAFGVGVVASALLPPTRAERSAAGRTQGSLDVAAAEIGAAGHQVVEDLRPAAKEAVDEVKEHGQESVASVSQSVKDARGESPA